MADLVVLPVPQRLRASNYRRLLVDLLTSLAVFNDQRHDIKIDKAIFWIENFHITTDRSAALRKR